jgi:opacity protein-like surface antigen
VTSTRRIPVQKEGTTVTESPGQISADSMERARQDSIAAAERARQDSIAAIERARQDSIAEAERARLAAEQARRDSIAAAERARQDSIAAAERAREERFRMGRFGGWYFNLGGGAAIPMGDFDDLYGTGWNVTGSVGWHPTESPFGVRFDIAYDRLNGEDPPGATAQLADAAVWSGLAEATLRIPRALGLNPYVVAGGGAYRFSDYGSSGGTSIYGGTNESSTEWGWNAGGGLRFGWGFTTLFVEARYMSVGSPGGNDRAEWVPIILGITFR